MSVLIVSLPASFVSLVNRLTLCCAVDFHDAKGELLHQTLMPKKMAKLDESPDFRPFKFRIQAFTNAFAEEVRLEPRAGTRVSFLNDLCPLLGLASNPWGIRRDSIR